MIANYWIKDTTRQEIITKTLIPNAGHFNLYANYYNLIDSKGLGFKICANTNLKAEKLYRKNGFEYMILEHNNQKTLYVLPSPKMEKYVDDILSKVYLCKNEEDFLYLLFDKML